MYDTGHKMDLNKVKVTATTKSYGKRLIREVIDIQKNKTVNREEGYYLSNTWKILLRKTIKVNAARLYAPRAHIESMAHSGKSVER